MPLPLIPIAAAAAAGIGGTLLGGWLGGGKKGEVHAPQEHYAPVHAPVTSSAQTYAPTYQYQIESPSASMSSKKDLTTKSEGSSDVAAPRSETATEGLDMTKIAIIGVVGLVVYGVVSKK